MASFEKELKARVSSALPELTPSHVAKVVTFLMSPEVGMSVLRELKSLTANMIPKEILVPIKAKHLVDVFTSDDQGNKGDAQRPSTSRDQTAGSIPRTSAVSAAQDILQNKDGYKFVVPWTSLPALTLSNLDKAQVENVMANTSDVVLLKSAIAKKLKSDYLAWREDHPGSQRHPGRKIYESVTLQVFRRYPDCLEEKRNGIVLGNARLTFKHLFEVCIENMMRAHVRDTPLRTVLKRKQIIGVDPAQYEPELTEDMAKEQEGRRTILDDLSGFEMNGWSDEVERDMLATYELQRRDIILANEQITQEAPAPDGNDEDEPLPKEKAIQVVLRKWPFLFTNEGLQTHHRRLTGRNLAPHLEKFIENELQEMMNFLVTNSSQNAKNLKLRLKLEKSQANVTPKHSFLCFAMMLANHFQEDSSAFIRRAEKTTLPEELNFDDGTICIVALDLNPFAAEKFFVCADGVPLMETTSGATALRLLIEICFVMDIHYPPLSPKTFELMERFIFEMGVNDTRVKNKGKYLTVLTEDVRKFIREYQEYSQEMEDSD